MATVAKKASLASSKITKRKSSIYYQLESIRDELYESIEKEDLQMEAQQLENLLNEILSPQSLSYQSQNQSSPMSIQSFGFQNEQTLVDQINNTAEKLAAQVLGDLQVGLNLENINIEMWKGVISQNILSQMSNLQLNDINYKRMGKTDIQIMDINAVIGDKTGYEKLKQTFGDTPINISLKTVGNENVSSLHLGDTASLRSFLAATNQLSENTKGSDISTFLGKRLALFSVATELAQSNKDISTLLYQINATYELSGGGLFTSDGEASPIAKFLIYIGHDGQIHVQPRREILNSLREYRVSKRERKRKQYKDFNVRLSAFSRK